MDNDHFRRAAEFWANGKPLDAGRIIYENIPGELRPRWAARILKLVLDKSGLRSSLFDQVLKTVETKEMWGEGHHIFESFRQSTLKLDDLRRHRDLSNDEDLLASILALGELVCKVIYNATTPHDEFDEDSGWWIAACLRAFVDNEWNEERFSRDAWVALSSSLE